MSHIDALREFMRARGLSAYIVPSTDPHLSEYVPEHWRRRAFLSGFTGSAGDLVVTLEAAGLWTDSRYFLQAETQLNGSGITLFRQGLPETPEMGTWIGDQLSSGQKVGVDTTLLSIAAFTKLRKNLSPPGIVLESVRDNPVDALWSERPPLPPHPLEVHPMAFTGETVASKLQRLRRTINERRADAHVLLALDGIAWLFNIRGSDVPFTPVAVAYAVVQPSEAALFIAPEKVTDELVAHLDGLVAIHDYNNFESYLVSLAKTGARVTVDPDATSQWVLDTLRGTGRIDLRRSPVTGLKSVKNPTELDGIAAAHMRDGVAMVRFLKWLESEMPKGGVTERSAAKQLLEIRSEVDRFKGLSFNTISAFGPNGAIVHYDPEEGPDTVIEPDGLYLVDSGAQYLDGTTDITRTVAIGSPTDEQRQRFTDVLRGHIRLASARFPAGTCGIQLDTLARKPLWDVGLNYGHGTGHGVGAYLSVHEGPQSISYFRGLGVPLVGGMILSIEPGYYKAGAYGIRIENLAQVIPDTDIDGEVPFLTFRPLTLCPLDISLIDGSLLDPDERRYLNRYHADVRSRLSPLLDADEQSWLAEATMELQP